MRLRTPIVALATALAALGLVRCGSDGDVGYAVRLAIVIDASVSDADDAAIKSLELQVESSLEHWYKTFAVTDQFESRRSRIIYRPAIASGRLPFTVRVRDGMGRLLGEGSTEVDLHPGATVDATLVVTAPTLLDGGVAHDLLPGPDLLMPDLAQPPDLATSNADLAQSSVDLAQSPPDVAQPPPDLATPPDDLAAPVMDMAVATDDADAPDM